MATWSSDRRRRWGSSRLAIPHRAQCPRIAQGSPRPPDLGPDEPPIERGVVRDEDLASQEVHDSRTDLAKCRLVAHHGLRDVRQTRDEWRDRPLRIDERFESIDHPAAADNNGRDLGHPVSMPRDPPVVSTSTTANDSPTNRSTGSGRRPRPVPPRPYARLPWSIRLGHRPQRQPRYRIRRRRSHSIGALMWTGTLQDN